MASIYIYIKFKIKTGKIFAYAEDLYIGVNF